MLWCLRLKTPDDIIYNRSDPIHSFDQSVIQISIVFLAIIKKDNYKERQFTHVTFETTLIPYSAT